MRNWRKSIALGQSLGARPELGRTYLEVGRRLFEGGGGREAGDLISAEACLAKAESLLASCGMDWDLARLDEVRKRRL